MLEPLTTVLTRRRARRMVPENIPTTPAPPVTPPPASEGDQVTSVEASREALRPVKVPEPTPDPNNYGDWALGQILEKVKKTEALHADLINPEGEFSKVLARHNADAAVKLASAAQKFEDSWETARADIQSVREDVTKMGPRIVGAEMAIKEIKDELKTIKKQREEDNQRWESRINELTDKLNNALVTSKE